MDPDSSLLATLALAAALGWASGLNAWAPALMLGVLGALGLLELPAGLAWLGEPAVLGSLLALYALEFVVDKIPGLDSLWDALQTAVRIPAGAALAGAVVAPVEPGFGLAAALAGGSLAATMHAAKSGTRALINTSPEPFSNWGASLAEDASVFAGVWLALHHPWVFLGLLAALLLALAWLLPKLWRGLRALAARISGWVRGSPARG